MSYLFGIVMASVLSLLHLLFTYVLDPQVDEAFKVLDWLIDQVCIVAGVQWNGFDDLMTQPFVVAAIAFLQVCDAWVPVKETIGMGTALVMVMILAHSMRFALRVYHELPAVFGWAGGKT